MTQATILLKSRNKDSNAYSLCPKEWAWDMEWALRTRLEAMGLYSAGRRKTSKQARHSIRVNMGVNGGAGLGEAGRSLTMGREKMDKRKQQETSRKIN